LYDTYVIVVLLLWLINISAGYGSWCTVCADGRCCLHAWGCCPDRVKVTMSLWSRETLDMLRPSQNGVQQR